MLRKMESNTGLISHISGKQTYSYLYHWSVRVWGTAWHSHQLQLLKVVKTWERSIKVLFSVKFSADHRPNVKSNRSTLNTWRAVHGNSMEIPLRQRVVYKVAQSFQTSSFLIHSWLKKRYFLLLLLVEHLHSRESSALLHCCVVKTL